MFWLAAGMPEVAGELLARTNALPSAAAVDAIGVFNKSSRVRSLRSVRCL
jgi:hypothetical protein